MNTRKRLATALLLSLIPLNATTAQDNPSDPKEFLQSLVGTWQGTCRTWFRPGTPLPTNPKSKPNSHSS